MTDKSISSVPLVEVIDALREDLKTAQEKSDPENPLIIDGIEIELQTVVTKEAGTNTKAEIQVLSFLGFGGVDVDASVTGAWANASTQKIKLKLSAKSRNPDTGELENTQVGDVDEF